MGRGPQPPLSGAGASRAARFGKAFSRCPAFCLLGSATQAPSVVVIVVDVGHEIEQMVVRYSLIRLGDVEVIMIIVAQGQCIAKPL
jgi:hypothetical protein